MDYLSLFSGIEAASVAWAPLGWRPLAFAEVDAFPSAVLRERFPSVPNLGDVTKVNWRGFVRDFGRPDVLVGGSPCQSFSIAGTRTGLGGASGLMWEYVRAVREVRPRLLLWENVPGALSSTHGEDFGCLLRSLDALGYGLAWRVLDAQFFGVAQRRERVFLVGRLGSRPPVEVLFEPEGVLWDSKSSREKRKELAKEAGRSPCSAGFEPITMADLNANTAIGYDMVGTLKVGGDAPSVCYCERAGGDKGALASEAVRRLTPRECERLQGFPSDWTKIPYRGRPADECPDGPRYKAIGNSMAVPVMRWIGERLQLAEEGSI